jgi:hypothetical protein
MEYQLQILDEAIKETSNDNEGVFSPPDLSSASFDNSSSNQLVLCRHALVEAQEKVRITCRIYLSLSYLSFLLCLSL